MGPWQGRTQVVWNKTNINDADADADAYDADVDADADNYKSMITVTNV